MLVLSKKKCSPIKKYRNCNIHYTISMLTIRYLQKEQRLSTSLTEVIVANDYNS